MWVEKVKNGFKFIERYTDPLTGKCRRVSVVLEKNTAQARKMAQKSLNAKIEQAILPQEKRITFSELVYYYRAEQKKTVKASTYKRNYHSAETLMKIIGYDTLVDQITAGYIRKSFLDTGKDSGTLNEHLKRLKSIIRWGYKNDYHNNISCVEKLERFNDVPHRVKIQDKFLESQEIKILLDKMKVQKWKLLTEFLVLSGLRFGEAAALLKSDIDFSQRIIKVTKNYDCINDLVTSPKTNFSIRDVYMQDELFYLCKILLCAEKTVISINTGNLLFPDEHGGHIQFYAYNKYLKETSLKSLGRSITPHTLRHTHASLLFEQGIDIDSISRRLGHESSKITREIYLHVTEKLKEKENGKLKQVKIL